MKKKGLTVLVLILAIFLIINRIKNYVEREQKISELKMMIVELDIPSGYDRYRHNGMQRIGNRLSHDMLYERYLFYKNRRFDGETWGKDFKSVGSQLISRNARLDSLWEVKQRLRGEISKLKN